VFVMSVRSWAKEWGLLPVGLSGLSMKRCPLGMKEGVVARL